MKRTRNDTAKAASASSSTNILGTVGANADKVDVAPLDAEKVFDTAYGDMPPNSAAPVKPQPQMAGTPNPPGDSNMTAEQDQQGVDPMNVSAQASNEDTPIHPIAALFPMLSEGSLAQLVDDIRIHGLAHAIVMHDGQIVDGRNRLLACRRAGVQPQFVMWREIYSGNCTLDEWIWSQNAHRRHMSRVQLAAGYLVVFGAKEREDASLARVEDGRRGGHIAGRGRRKQDRLLAKPPATNSADSVGEGTDRAEPRPARAKAAHSTGRRNKLAASFNISAHAAKQLLQVDAARPELLRDIVQGSLTLAKAFKLACPTDPTEVPSGMADLEPVIRKAVRAVEKLLARVPEDQQDDFKTAVADTVRKLA